MFQVLLDLAAWPGGFFYFAWPKRTEETQERSLRWTDFVVSFLMGKPHGYGSIPIDTIFSGMNIHLPAILGSPGVQGFDTLPHVACVALQPFCITATVIRPDTFQPSSMGLLRCRFCSCLLREVT